jgi:glycosyltransferase involved in cell wall biosynthesis
MKLLIITQKIDINDDLLGFMNNWVAEFAKYCEKVTVVCLYKGKYELPENVKVLSLGKENNAPSLKYILNFYKFIWQERKSYDKVFVHMNKEYIWMGSILWKLMRKKIVFWYAHYKTELPAKISLWLSDRIATSTRLACKYKSKKLTIVGQGINTDFFRNLNYELDDKKINILSLGRITPVKNIDTLIRAFSLAAKKDDRIFLNLVGESSPEYEEYFQGIKDLVKNLRLESRVKFLGRVSNKEALDFYNKNDIFINLTESGSFDKTTLEAMACESLVLVSNLVFREIFPEDLQKILMFKERDEKDLAKRLINFINLSKERKDEIEKINREIIVRNHSLKNLVKNIMRVLEN